MQLRKIRLDPVIIFYSARAELSAIFYQFCIQKSTCFMPETAVNRISFFLEFFMLCEVIVYIKSALLSHDSLYCGRPKILEVCRYWGRCLHISKNHFRFPVNFLFRWKKCKSKISVLSNTDGNHRPGQSGTTGQLFFTKCGDPPQGCECKYEAPSGNRSIVYNNGQKMAMRAF